MKYIVFEPDTMIPHEFDTPEECEIFLLNYYKKKSELDPKGDKGGEA